MTAKKTVKKSKVTKKKAAEPTPVQEGLQVTWRLKGDIKRAQRAYLRIAEQLIYVRDKKLFVALKHADMEDYAQRRLGLGRASLFRYLQVYDWVSRKHPGWLEPKAKGFIPELDDTSGLIWIEAQLENPDLDPARRAALLELDKKGLAGALRQAELNAFRRKGRKGPSGLKTVLSKLRTLRRQSATLPDMPAEALELLDTLIEVVKNDHALKLAGVHDAIPFADGPRGNILA
jgi:hypothetical protein